QAGYRAMIAGDGETALAQIRKHRPDIVVLDGMLPNLDGFEVLRHMKADAATAEIPVVMLTARGLEKDVIDGLNLGADEYMIKPFMIEELLVRVRRLVGRQPARKAET